MNDITSVVSNQQCSGCSACFSVCPVNAISMQRNSEGFLIPTIDQKKCIHCNLCNQVCPLLVNKISDEQRDIPTTYAGWAKDELIRKKSSSGGIFSILAQYVLDNRGYVCGASFDKNKKLSHVIVSRKSELEKLRGSKYLQSEIGNVFRQIKELLDNNKLVLFVGVPCQIAGLKTYLRKEYKTLIAVDIVCHGVPSSLVFEKYVKEIEKNNKISVTNIKFRDKITGWKSFSITLKNDKKTIYSKILSDDIYGKGFLSNLYLTPICTSCPFSMFPKYSDITLGDYWGIWEYKKQLDDDKGTSLILVNNDKGEYIFNQIKINIKYEKIPNSSAIYKLRSISTPVHKHSNRANFFKELNLSSASISKIIENNLETSKKCPDLNKSVAIFNMRLPSSNYGAMLQSYALYKTVCKLGYQAKVIDYYSEELDKKSDKFITFPFRKFREKFIDITGPCKTDEDLVSLNNCFETFIVGSDQVWNYNYLNGMFKNDIGKYFLNFVLSSKRKISYAPSFAESYWGGNDDEINEVKNNLRFFSGVSVREISGIDICRNLFGIKAKCVLDPTLLLDRSDYEKIIESEYIEKEKRPYVAYFSLDEHLEETVETYEPLQKMITKNNWQLINIRGSKKIIFNESKFIYHSVPSWLNYIKNCELLITDSYHATIFAIIFNKQFVVLERDYAGNERLKSLFSLLKVRNRFFTSITAIKDFELINLNTINYEKVNNQVIEKAKHSIEFLKNSLKAKNIHKDVNNTFEEEFLVNRAKYRSQLDKTTELENKTQILDSALKAYLNTKTFRYSAKIKVLLKKIGIKKIKV